MKDFKKIKYFKNRHIIKIECFEKKSSIHPNPIALFLFEIHRYIREQVEVVLG
jgi:hypothetical protein